MFNNINENGTDFLYNSQLEKQGNIVNLTAIRANAYKAAQTVNTNPYVDKTEISSSAIELFQRDCDINKFNKIALSDPEDLSHLDIMQDLFSHGVVDVFEDDVLSNLVTNDKLWDDLRI